MKALENPADQRPLVLPSSPRPGPPPTPLLADSIYQSLNFCKVAEDKSQEFLNILSQVSYLGGSASYPVMVRTLQQLHQKQPVLRTTTGGRPPALPESWKGLLSVYKQLGQQERHSSCVMQTRDLVLSCKRLGLP